MSNIPRLKNDSGLIAVLISPGYGAGWSSWANPEQKEVLLFHRDIAQALLNSGPAAAIEKAKEILGDEYFYDGGGDSLVVQWIKPGTRFEINEYDGYETLIEIGGREYFKA